MLKSKFNFIYFFLMFFAIGCSKKIEEVKVEKKAPVKEMGIIKIRNTAMRIDPYIFSGRIILLKKGDILEIMGRSGEKTWIGKSHDYWFKVKLKKGMTGWVFGKNIKVVSSENSEEIDSIVTDFFKDETERVRKSLSGKWWSVNRFGDFTGQGLEFSVKGKYKSYRKAQNPRVIDGEYSIDFHDNLLIFDKGATFGKELQLVQRGRSYLLKKELKVGELVFKKISIETTIGKKIQKKVP